MFYNATCTKSGWNNSTCGTYMKHQWRLFSNGNEGKEIITTRLTGDDTGITILSMNRVSKRNALGKQFMSELIDEITNLENDFDTRVVIIESKCDNVFCAGADLKEREEMTNEQGGEFVKLLRDTFTRIEVLLIILTILARRIKEQIHKQRNYCNK